MENEKIIKKTSVMLYASAKKIEELLSKNDKTLSDESKVELKKIVSDLNKIDKEMLAEFNIKLSNKVRDSILDFL